MTTRHPQAPRQSRRSAAEVAATQVAKQRSEQDALAKAQAVSNREILVSSDIQRAFDEETVMRALQEARVAYARAKVEAQTAEIDYGKAPNQVADTVYQAAAQAQARVEKLVELLSFVEFAELEYPKPPSGKLIVPEMRVEGGKVQALVPGK